MLVLFYYFLQKQVYLLKLLNICLERWTGIKNFGDIPKLSQILLITGVHLT